MRSQNQISNKTQASNGHWHQWYVGKLLFRLWMRLIAHFFWSLDANYGPWWAWGWLWWDMLKVKRFLWPNDSFAPNLFVYSSNLLLLCEDKRSKTWLNQWVSERPWTKIFPRLIRSNLSWSRTCHHNEYHCSVMHASHWSSIRDRDPLLVDSQDRYLVWEKQVSFCFAITTKIGSCQGSYAFI